MGTFGRVLGFALSLFITIWTLPALLSLYGDFAVGYVTIITEPFVYLWKLVFP